jgi:hypothetical protein
LQAVRLLYQAQRSSSPTTAIIQTSTRLIGTAVAGSLILSGRIAGISGAFNEALEVFIDRFYYKNHSKVHTWYSYFVAGLVIGAVLLRFVIAPEAFIPLTNLFFTTSVSILNQPVILFAIAGLLVGAGYCSHQHVLHSLFTAHDLDQVAPQDT